MKKLRYALLTLALLTPAALIAQESGSPGGGQTGRQRHLPSVDDQLQKLSRRLRLTDAQKPQVTAILQDQHDQMKALMDNPSGKRAERMSKMGEIRQNSSAKIRELLTDAQKTKFDKMQEKHNTRQPRQRGGDQGGPPPVAPDHQ